VGKRRKKDKVIKLVPREGDVAPMFAMEGEPLALEVQRVAHQVTFAASEELVRNLERLGTLTGGSFDEILLKATEALLDKVDPARRHARREARKAKTAAAATPRAKEAKLKPDAKPEPRAFPQAVKDAAIVASGERCTFVAAGGQRCTERVVAHLQGEHVEPYAWGGASTASNCAILCGAHNRFVARQTMAAGT
jgi:hypothetical protein